MQMSIPTQMSTTISATPLTSPGYKREDDSPQMGSSRGSESGAKRMRLSVGDLERVE